MGRSYSEHPFEDPQPALGMQGSGPRLGNDEDKQKLGQQKTKLPDMPTGFRQPHAETIQRYQQRAAQRAKAQGGAEGERRAAAKKAVSAAKKAAPAAKKAAKKAPAAKKDAMRAREAATQEPARQGKTVARVAAAAKTVVQRVAKKVSARKAQKKR